MRCVQDPAKVSKEFFPSTAATHAGNVLTLRMNSIKMALKISLRSKTERLSVEERENGVPYWRDYLISGGATAGVRCVVNQNDANEDRS